MEGGWRILLLSPHTDRSAARLELGRWKITRLVSKDTQTTEIADYTDRIVRMPLDELAARIPAGDPRRDSWTESLGDWFSGAMGGKTLEIWYARSSLPAELAPRAFAKSLAALGIAEASGGRGREFPGAPTWALAFAAIVCLPTLFLRGSKKRSFLAMSLPWAVYCAAVGARHGIFALAASAGGLFAIEEIASAAAPDDALPAARRSSRLRGLFLQLALPLYAALLLSAVSIPSMIAVSLSSAFARRAACRREGDTRPRRFIAVPIRAGRHFPIRPIPPRLSIVALILGLLVVAPISMESRRSALRADGAEPAISVPVPAGTVLGGGGPPSLPGLDAWRKHLDNELAFFDGALRGTGMTAPRRVVADTPEERPMSTTRFVPSKGCIESVLADQGGAHEFTMGDPSDERPEPLALWRLLLYIIGPIIAFAAMGDVRGAFRRRTGRHP